MLHARVWLAPPPRGAVVGFCMVGVLRSPCRLTAVVGRRACCVPPGYIASVTRRLGLRTASLRIEGCVFLHECVPSGQCQDFHLPQDRQTSLSLPSPAKPPKSNYHRLRKSLGSPDVTPQPSATMSGRKPRLRSPWSRHIPLAPAPGCAMRRNTPTFPQTMAFLCV
jgi:hypothetical protein